MTEMESQGCVLLGAVNVIRGFVLSCICISNSSGIVLKQFSNSDNSILFLVETF